jgi:hypothetical protein
VMDCGRLKAGTLQTFKMWEYPVSGVERHVALGQWEHLIVYLLLAQYKGFKIHHAVYPIVPYAH